jgi:hypothetical protein
MKLETPIEIDTALAELYDKQYDLRVSKMSAEQSIEFVKKYYPNSERQMADAVKRVEIVDAKLAVLKAEIAEIEKLYTGWSRAFLVSNANGHIHSTMSCSTCFANTRFLWLPNLSGEDRMKIAELAGESACTICYPDAPSEYFLRKSQLEDPKKVQAREEREAKKKERDAKKLLTGITNPDGTDLVILERRYRNTIKTERTAQSWAVENIYWISQYAGKDWLVEEVAERKKNHEIVLVALAHKRGTSVEEQRTLIKDKASSKYKNSVV